MNVQERDARILEHILTCCDQIDMAVERFGHSFDLFDSDPVYRTSKLFVLRADSAQRRMI